MLRIFKKHRFQRKKAEERNHCVTSATNEQKILYFTDKQDFDNSPFLHLSYPFHQSEPAE